MGAGQGRKTPSRLSRHRAPRAQRGLGWVQPWGGPGSWVKIPSSPSGHHGTEGRFFVLSARKYSRWQFLFPQPLGDSP